MSGIKDLTYDIQELYIEGHSARSIAMILECDMETVLSALDDMGLEDFDEEFGPYITINS